MVKRVTEAFPDAVTHEQIAKLTREGAVLHGKHPPIAVGRLKVFTLHPLFVNVEQTQNSIKAMLHPAVMDFCKSRGTIHFTLNHKDEVLKALGLKQERNNNNKVVPDKFVDRKTGTDWTRWKTIKKNSVHAGTNEEAESKSANETEYQAIIKELDNASLLDAIRQISIRREQTFLRKWLFGDRIAGECCICGR